MTSPPVIYITLEEVKDQLSIDYGLTQWDNRLNLLIGSAIDWAENFTQRSLGELLILDDPADSSAVPLPNPADSPRLDGRYVEPGERDFSMIDWTEDEWRTHWRNLNPIAQDDSQPLRRDVKLALLMWIEGKFDRNIANWKLIEETVQQMLTPYRIGMGV